MTPLGPTWFMVNWIDMPDKRYFAGLAGALLLGILALVIAGVVFFLVLPFLAALALGLFMLVAAFILIWAAVYSAMAVGVGIYCLFKPIEVSKKKGKYSLKRTREAGKRQKTKTRKH